ncbi:CPBP family intramembrane metalloprotease [Thermoactinomyces intermedius]|uniref:CPBP family intramembrane metalloprotease n=1 Tax=Thermoactinomyces intermedius TaxID=2024 RepID=A0A8I1ACF1_THEIN|nr:MULTISPECIES: type II CAAX endopeptidase family protein [Thermoactinomyces]MBA4548939.1 CPBP family intramembrane metalloprotease [Thermoactinomyces intermedius]MBA4835585.1 CPBP family intramembrane metalloprotease [Thermoactinomyces intermedius]MBH8595346.1 CPBP family intramembrane metalloprotease [Thermoactinomyces intermedius]MBH8601259.1 CPBP family intramembrane metalloprotease [Thermoactinomyces sp. CICC 23799]
MKEHGSNDSSSTAKQVLSAFYITQFLLFAISAVALWWQGKSPEHLFSFHDIHMWVWGIGAGGLILAVDAVLMACVPESWMDDGGLNQLLFENRSRVHVLVIALIAAVSEEMFFRGVLQEWLGIWMTSVVFVLLHTRYLKKWLLMAVVFAISAGLGWLTEWFGNITPAVIAHGLVDFVSGLFIRHKAKSGRKLKT